MSKITGEIEAKAVLKGKLRLHKQAFEDIQNKKLSRLKNGGTKRNKSFAHTVYQEHLDGFGELLVTKSEYKRASTWHWKALFSGMEYELAPVEDIGNLCRYIVCYFDSRKFIKEDRLQGFNMWFSDFYFHEHFLERGILRFNTRSLGAIAEICYPVISWLIKENIPPSRFDDFNYIVFREFVIVTQKLTMKRGIIFKTLLLKDVMDENQMSFYSQPYEYLDEHENVNAVLLNARGDIVRSVVEAEDDMSLVDVIQCSNWLSHVGQKEDIRKF